MNRCAAKLDSSWFTYDTYVYPVSFLTKIKTAYFAWYPKKNNSLGAAQDEVSFFKWFYLLGNHKLQVNSNVWLKFFLLDSIILS